MNDIQRLWQTLLQIGIVVFALMSISCMQSSAIEPDVQTSQTGMKSEIKNSTSSIKNSDDRKGTDWPRFLGPAETGISTETGLLITWPKNGPSLVWQKEVGTGYSAPSVLGDQLVLHHRVGREERVKCFSASDGSPIWSHKYSSDYRDPYGYNNGPRCTPILRHEHCFTLGAEGSLRCLNLKTGDLIWKHELLKEFDVKEAFFGVGATPILEGNKLIVLVGGQPNAGVVAYDAKSGKKLWQNVGKDEWDGMPTGDGDEKYRWTGEEMVVSYSSPIAVTIHDQRHILCLMRQGLVSLNPENGEVNFAYWFRSPKHESVNAARPVVVDDTIFLSAAYRVGSVLLKVSKDNKSVVEVWRDSENLLAHWSTPIFLDGHYYGFSGRHENEGEFRCIEAKTGKVVWKTSGFEGDLSRFGVADNGRKIIDRTTNEVVPWPYYGRGSCILAEGQFLVLGERGTLALVTATSKSWQEVSRFAPAGMRYPSWTAPVLSRGRLYLRCEDNLVCYDLKQPEK